LEENIQTILGIQKITFDELQNRKDYPASPASDAEVNIETVTVISPQGNTHTIRAYRKKASVLREYVSLLKLKE
jgi:hypothetical protein